MTLCRTSMHHRQPGSLPRRQLLAMMDLHHLPFHALACFILAVPSLSYHDIWPDESLHRAASSCRFLSPVLHCSCNYSIMHHNHIHAMPWIRLCPEQISSTGIC
ncbi:hypothetical protein P692DRAFT_20452702 [Suillus brevipes Sb2]|nr:hypothetical protein P692DRAFT_20452702 [Suillus brevipes Sb2]